LITLNVETGNGKTKMPLFNLSVMKPDLFNKIKTFFNKDTCFHEEIKIDKFQ